MTNLYNEVLGKTNGMLRHFRENNSEKPRFNETSIQQTYFATHLAHFYVHIYCNFQTIRWTIKLLTLERLYFLYVGPLSSLESSKDDFEEPFDDSSGRQWRRVQSKRTSRCQRSRASTRLRNELSQSKECKYSQSCHFLLFYCETGFEAASWPD